MAFYGPTHSTKEAAQNRLEMAMEWGDLSANQNPRVVEIRNPRQKRRWAIEADPA